MQQAVRELKSTVEARDCRVEVLEAELEALSRTKSDNGDALEHQPPSGALPVSPEAFEVLKGAVGDLSRKLDECQGKLTYSELRASMLNLQKATQEMNHLGVVRKLEASLSEAHDELSRFRSGAKKDEVLSLELEQLRAGITRRDEQLEFLLHVHEASAGYEWTRPGAAPGSGSGDHHEPVVAPLDGRSIGGVALTPRGGGFDPDLLVGLEVSPDHQHPAAVGSPRNAVAALRGLAALKELGLDEAVAKEALEAAGGDLDRAVLSLFPLD